MILKCVSKHCYENTNTCSFFQVRAKAQHHKFLIGRNGANIKKIRDSTGARVMFPSTNDEDRELITIIGKKDAVEQAKALLMKSIKDIVSNRLLHNF